MANGDGNRLSTHVQMSASCLCGGDASRRKPPARSYRSVSGSLLGVVVAIVSGCVSTPRPVPVPPEFAYCLWHRRDVEHAEEILTSLKGTACKTIFVCPMYNLAKWNASEIEPASRSGLQPDETEFVARLAKRHGFVVALQPNLTINASVERDMLPSYNSWWQMFAHTSEATWETWTRELERQAVIAQRVGARYLVCLHEADVLLIYPGWEGFIRTRLRTIAPDVKLVYSQHSMQHLRLYYRKHVNLGIFALQVTDACGDRGLAAARVFEMVGRSTLSPSFQMPTDEERRRQLGQDLLKSWVLYRPPWRLPWQHPYLDLVREDFDALKSSDYWPLVYQGRDHDEMVKLYHQYRFEAKQRILWWRPRYTVRFSQAQKHTRRLFGTHKAWFRETGLEALPKGVEYADMCEPFVRATQDAWTGFTDCIVWWGNGYDTAFIAAMRAMRE